MEFLGMSFGKSVKELEDLAKVLDERNLELKNRESDVKQNEENLKHERELLESAKSALQKERADFRENAERLDIQAAQTDADLEKRRQEVIRLEAQAKEGFAKTQQETFKELIEKRIAELDARQADLDKLAESIADQKDKNDQSIANQKEEFARSIASQREKLAESIASQREKLTAKEGEVARRELAVTEREQNADAGFADKVSALAAEAKRQHEANLQQHEANLQKAKQLEDRENQLADQKKQLEDAKESLRQREQKIFEAENQRDAGYVDLRTALDKEINDKRTAWQNEAAQQRSALQKDLTDKKSSLLADLEKEIASVREQRLIEISTAEENERNRIQKTAKEDAQRIRQQIEKEQQDWDDKRTDQQAELKMQNEANEKKAGELSAKEDELAGMEHELRNNEKNLENQQEKLEQTVEQSVAERKATFDSMQAEYLEEITNLRNALQIQTGLVGAFDQLKRQLGDSAPEELLRDLNSKSDELKRLHEELATRPTEEMRERYEILEKETGDQKERIKNLEDEKRKNAAAVAEVIDLRRQNEQLTMDKTSLAQRMELWEAAANEANAELKRLRSAYERPAEVAARYKEIEMPYITAGKTSQPAALTEDSNTRKLTKVQRDFRNTKQDDKKKLKEEEKKRLTRLSAQEELQWLDSIGNACDNYGLHFPQRILRAFHTALKTAEWSPITILAGVSGTGKSELPRLYSHFGGLLFDPLSVQPNWDSQESMLGFFNSIDNKFDAQPVLRFLAQSQQTPDESYEKRMERWEKMAGSTLNIDPKKQEELIRALQESNYPGLKDCVCMVLLDEMNLAHPELYFAEFLSKLELRRGMKGEEVPYLPVKIGAGLPPYQLPLGRNVFWTGTMNQDETTKSLSDKVLDRSIIIYFPRPTELKRRKELKPLDDKNRGTLLHKDTFFSWFAQESEFEDEQIKPYKDFVEEMNKSLGAVGRAIGHRVWQSIEYYMANYPDVRAALNADGGSDEASLQKAMHTAFEDQLVQKVMPKLRGIDTRGKSRTECLDKILSQLKTGINGHPFNLNEDFTLACELGYGQFIWQSANYLNEEPTNNIVSDDPKNEGDRQSKAR